MGSKIKISVIATGFSDNYPGNGPRAMFGSYGRESRRKMAETSLKAKPESSSPQSSITIDRAPSGFTQPQPQVKKEVVEEDNTPTNPFVRSALFNLKKKEDEERVDQSDKVEDVDSDQEFAEFEVPAFLRDRK
ncbi:hypothetical protein SDC9_176897 [bioreactor metagenome]|uniref:Cell division protein FtsZ n=1 Tax=bioreactor metagenome TaxID=1076179 RepID=A0A645GZG3_9ZZZZ